MPLSRIKIVFGPEKEVIEENSGHSQKEFNDPFFEIRSDKIQMESTFQIKSTLQGIGDKAPLFLDVQLILPGQPTKSLKD